MSFIENLDAAVRYLGAQQLGIVYNLASVQWESSEDRDAFLRLISGRVNP